MALSDRLKFFMMSALGAPDLRDELANAIDANTAAQGGDIHSDGSVPFAANQSMGSHKLTSVTDPTAAQDAATKAYVDGRILVFTSNASAGGSANEVYVVTGLLSTDTILSVSQSVKGANSLPLLGYNTLVNNALTGVYSADPGANAIIKVNIKR